MDKIALDPVTGFQVDKELGHFVGLHQKPVAPVPTSDYPKWVTPHSSQIVRTGDNVSTPGFPEMHIDRSGNVTVLVADETDEMRAISPAGSAEPEKKPLGLPKAPGKV